MAQELADMSAALLVGVDGGKSKTICLTVDTSGHVLGWGRSGSSDRYDLPFEQAVDAIQACTRQALDMAGISPVNAIGCFGLAGTDWPEDFTQLYAALEQSRLVHQLAVKNDAIVALRAGAPEGYGVVVSAGTHLAAAIHTPDGQEWHSAWFSVEGAGGVAVGHQVLWAVLKAEDGRGKPTALTDLVLQAKNLSHPLELLRLLSQGGIDDSYKASLAPLLFVAHQRYGDTVAGELILEVAHDMASWPIALLRRYKLDKVPMPVVLSGGLFKAGDSLLIETISNEILACFPKVELRLARREPVAGAILIAAEQAGVPLTSTFLATLDASMPPASFFSTG
jgi:N-acetylglucosamine kinase-like BadF-type ATPase